MKAKNNIYTLDGTNIIHAATGRIKGWDSEREITNFLRGWDSEGEITTFLEIDLADSFKFDWFVKCQEDNDLGEAPFFDQFRKMLVVRGETDHDKLEDPDLLKDKIVVVDFGKSFNYLEYAKEGDYTDTYDSDDTYHLKMNQKTRDLLKAINIRFEKGGEYRRFVSFDKSQSMARNSRITYIDEKYLTPYVHVPTICITDPSKARQELGEWCKIINSYGSDVFAVNPDQSIDYGSLVEETDCSKERYHESPLLYALKKRVGDKIFASGKMFVFRLAESYKEMNEQFEKVLKVSDVKDYQYEMGINAPTVECRINSTIERYNSWNGNDLFKVISLTDYYTEPIILSEEDYRVYYLAKDLFKNEADYKNFMNEVKDQELLKKWSSLYLDQRLMLGLDFSNISLAFSKFYAYRGLYLSTAKRIDGIELNRDTVVVLNDEQLSYKGIAQCITNSFSGEDLNIEIREKELENDPMFDGEGLISPDYADLLNNELFGAENGKGSRRAYSFQVRMPFIKGMLHTVKYHEFLKEYLGENREKILVTDYFGKKRDLLKAEIILTPSMFKGADWLNEICSGMSDGKEIDPMELFFDRIAAFEHAMYISGTDVVYKGRSYTTLSYQFLNTLALTKDEVNKLAEGHLAFIDDPEKTFSLSNGLTQTDNIEEDIPESDEENSEPKNDDVTDDTEDTEEEQPENEAEASSIEDEYTDSESAVRWISLLSDKQKKDVISFFITSNNEARNMLKKFQYKLIWNIAEGKLLVPGEIRYLSRDLLLLLKLLLQLSGEVDTSKIDRELLSVDEMDMPCAGEGFKNGDLYPVFRNPHLSRNEQSLLRMVSYKTNSVRGKYLSHLGGVLMVSGESFVPKTLGGADFDGDIVKVFNSPIIRDAVIKGVYNAPAKDGPLERKLPIIDIQPYETKKLRYNFEDIARYKTIFDTFSSKVGMISDMAIRRGQKIYKPGHENETKRTECAVCTILTGLEIDACKTGKHPTKPLQDAMEKDKKRQIVEEDESDTPKLIDKYTKGKPFVSVYAKGETVYLSFSIVKGSNGSRQKTVIYLIKGSDRINTLDEKDIRLFVDAYDKDCKASEKNIIHHWYLCPGEEDGGAALVSENGKRITVDAVQYDLRKKEAVFINTDKAYHCPLSECRFSEQDLYPDLLPEYEKTLKAKCEQPYDYLSQFLRKVKNYKKDERGGLKLPKASELKNLSVPEDNAVGSPVIYLPGLFVESCKNYEEPVEEEQNNEIRLFDFEEDDWKEGIQEKYDKEYKKIIKELEKYNDQLKRNRFVRCKYRARVRKYEWRFNNSKLKAVRIIRKQKNMSPLKSEGYYDLYKLADELVRLIDEKRAIKYPYSDQKDYVRGVFERIRNSDWPFLFDEESKKDEMQYILEIPIEENEFKPFTALFKFEGGGYYLFYALLNVVFNCHIPERKELEEYPIDVTIKKILKKVDEDQHLELLYSIPREYDKDKSLVLRFCKTSDIVKHLKVGG